jgi:CheY-like chemotaxis protein/HD-like signal output (HDOD) protein
MILIIDDMPIIREPISELLRSAGYETICASDGPEGLEMARSRAPDLIVLDLAMPIMDGVQVLQKLRSDPRTASTPVLVLTAMADRERVVLAKKFGAQEYMLKSRFSTKDLLARVKRHFSKSPAAEVDQESLAVGIDSAAGAKPTEVHVGISHPSANSASTPDHRGQTQLDSRKCIQRIRNATNGKALSGIVAEVIATAASPRGDSAELAKLVSSDPILTARVLGAANSAAYANKSGVCMTVSDAVRKIGFSGVRNITAAVGIFDSMPSSTGNGFSPLRHWQHSIAVAQLCESLVSDKIKEMISPGRAYICGLCHDLGEIVVRGEFEKEYRQILEKQLGTGRPRDELVQEMLGLSHGRLVMEALRAIGLPDDIREPIENFHAGKTSVEKAGPIPGILRVTDRYANGLLLTADQDSKIEAFERSFLRSVLGVEEFTAPDTESCCSQVRSLTITLARLGRNEEAQLLVPLYPKSAAKRVWLARDPQFSDFDPVHCALAQLADVKVYPSLPTAKDRPAYDYLVVAARNPTVRGFTHEDIAQVTAEKGGPAAKLTWLVAPARGADASNAVSPRQMPVRLSDLATFLVD